VLASAPVDPNALILNRVQLQLRIDPTKQRIDLEPSEVGNTNLGVALTGSLDFSSDDPRLTLTPIEEAGQTLTDAQRRFREAWLSSATRNSF